MTRYTMPARSQGKLYAQRAADHLELGDTHRWVFVHGLTPEVEVEVEVEVNVRKWLLQRLNGLYCDDTPLSTSSMAQGDEADAYGLNAVKALIKATGIACTPAPHMRSERKTIDEKGEG